MTKIADIFNRVLWAIEDFLTTSELTNVVNSGIVTGDAKIANVVSNMDTGTKISIPFVQEETYVESNISNDADTDAAIAKLSKVEADARVTFLNKVWGEKTIARLIGSGANTLDYARSYFSKHWAKEIQARMLSILDGAIASNKANNASDNVLVDIANKFSYALTIDALLKTGDHMDNFDTVVMHSSVMGEIMKNDAASITTERDSTNGIVRKYYNGLEIIMNDAVTIVADAVNGNRATTIFIKKGAFVFEPAKVDFPVEQGRNELDGNGGGSDYVITRLGFLLHLNGYSYVGTPADVSPSVAELADPTAWTRLVPAKLAPFVALETLI